MVKVGESRSRTFNIISGTLSRMCLVVGANGLDDLFRSKSLSDHLYPLFLISGLALQLDKFLGGRFMPGSKAAK